MATAVKTASQNLSKAFGGTGTLTSAQQAAVSGVQKAFAPSSSISPSSTKQDTASGSYGVDKKTGLPVGPGNDTPSGKTTTTPAAPTLPGTQVNPPNAPTPEATPPAPAAPTNTNNTLTTPPTGVITDPLTGQQFSRGSSGTFQRYQQAHTALQGTEAPAEGGAARTAISGAMPPQEAASSAVDTYISSDPGVNNLMKAVTDILQPQNQTTSLMQDYKKLYKQSGLDEINHELIDADTIINGTEQDIRNEVQGAGGFATDSQVQAMALSRNKGLLKRYNQLVQMKTDATNQLNTLSSLNAQDKQMAQTRLNTQLDAMFKVATFQQQAQNNVREAFNNMVAKVGYAGAYAAYASDPRQLGFIEQTMGLEPGGLSKLAAQPDLDRLAKEASIRASNATAARAARPNLQFVPGTANQPGGVFNADTGEFVPTSSTATNNTQQLAINKANVDTVTSILANPSLSDVVGPNVASRSDTSLGGTLSRFGAGAVGGGLAGAGAGALFGGIGAIPGALAGALAGGVGLAAKGFLPAVTGGTQNAIGDIEQVRQQLTLQNLQDAKKNGATFGALSDAELNLLSQSATKLGTWAVKDSSGNVIGYNVSESAFRKELDKINNFAKLDYVLKGGNAQDVGIQLMPDGHYYTANSDGSFTKVD